MVWKSGLNVQLIWVNPSGCCSFHKHRQVTFGSVASWEILINKSWLFCLGNISWNWFYLEPSEILFNFENLHDFYLEPVSIVLCNLSWRESFNEVKGENKRTLWFKQSPQVFCCSCKGKSAMSLCVFVCLWVLETGKTNYFNRHKASTL